LPKRTAVERKIPEVQLNVRKSDKPCGEDRFLYVLIESSEVQLLEFAEIGEISKMKTNTLVTSVPLIEFIE
jgi:hypothetical protein